MRSFLRKSWKVITAPFRALWWLITLPFRGIKRLYGFLNDVPPDRPAGEALDAAYKNPQGVFAHLNYLRRHLLRSLIGLAVMVVVSFIFTQDFVALLAEPVGGLEALQAIDVTESVGVFMRVALLSGFALATPYIAFELWLFFAPGLSPRSRKMGLFGIPLATLFFLGGMAFAYFILLPPALEFLLNFMGVSVSPRPASYIGFVTGVLFWIGVAFEFPLIVYVLSAAHILKPQALLKHWRIAAVVIALLAAAITPTTDPVNMTLVMVPMFLLYFIGIGLGYVAVGGRRKKQEG